MKVYAVRQKSTGLFIPRLERGKRRGGSWLEPSNEREPRIFHNRVAARAFLGNWLKGIFKNETHTSWVEGEVETYAVPEKQPHRKKEDMEIVEFDCFEANQGGKVSGNLIVRHEFNARNQPSVLIRISVDGGVTKVSAPAIDAIIIPDQTGVNVSVEYIGMRTSDVLGRLEIIRTST